MEGLGPVIDQWHRPALVLAWFLAAGGPALWLLSVAMTPHAEARVRPWGFVFCTLAGVLLLARLGQVRLPGL